MVEQSKENRRVSCVFVALFRKVVRVTPAPPRYDGLPTMLPARGVERVEEGYIIHLSCAAMTRRGDVERVSEWERERELPVGWRAGWPRKERERRGWVQQSAV